MEKSGWQISSRRKFGFCLFLATRRRFGLFDLFLLMISILISLTTNTESLVFVRVPKWLAGNRCRYERQKRSKCRDKVGSLSSHIIGTRATVSLINCLNISRKQKKIQQRVEPEFIYKAVHKMPCVYVRAGNRHFRSSMFHFILNREKKLEIFISARAHNEEREI